MDLCEYQKRARSTAIYLRAEGSRMLYPALGIIGECGEVAEKVKKLVRGDDSKMEPKRSEAIKKELGDCCWYLANICCDTGHDLIMAYKMIGASITHTLRELTLPQLVIRMNRYANMIAGSLEEWYYVYDCELRYRDRYTEIPRCISEILACVKEIANRCDSTLEDVFVANIEKLSGRKDRGTLQGDGDNR